jgi:hypothetical protein
MTSDAPAEANPGEGAVAAPETGSASIWQHKAWWCQPWSILLTGVVLIGACWWTFQWWWLTVLVALAVAIWWLLFLVLVPRAWTAEQFRNRA